MMSYGRIPVVEPIIKLKGFIVFGLEFRVYDLYRHSYLQFGAGVRANETQMAAHIVTSQIQCRLHPRLSG